MENIFYFPQLFLCKNRFVFFSFSYIQDHDWKRHQWCNFWICPQCQLLNRLNIVVFEQKQPQHELEKFSLSKQLSQETILSKEKNHCEQADPISATCTERDLFVLDFLSLSVSLRLWHSFCTKAVSLSNSRSMGFLFSRTRFGCVRLVEGAKIKPSTSGKVLKSLSNSC